MSESTTNFTPATTESFGDYAAEELLDYSEQLRLMRSREQIRDAQILQLTKEASFRVPWIGFLGGLLIGAILVLLEIWIKPFGLSQTFNLAYGQQGVLNLNFDSPILWICIVAASIAVCMLVDLVVSLIQLQITTNSTRTKE